MLRYIFSQVQKVLISYFLKIIKKKPPGYTRTLTVLGSIFTLPGAISSMKHFGSQFCSSSILFHDGGLFPTVVLRSREDGKIRNFKFQINKNTKRDENRKKRKFFECMTHLQNKVTIFQNIGRKKFKFSIK